MPEILEQFELPADTAPSTAIKDLETEVFSVTNLRTWLVSRMETIAPVSRTPTGDTQPVATPEVTATTAVVEPTKTSVATEHVIVDKTITGKTTFQQLLDWGVPEELIQQIIGGELPVIIDSDQGLCGGKSLGIFRYKSGASGGS